MAESPSPSAPATIIDGKVHAERLRAQVTEEVALLKARHGLQPGLAVVLVGRPIAQLLLQADCTVTIAHSRSRDLPAICRQADVLVAAVGRPRMVQGDWVKPGATVIDVGINRTDDGLVGDVDFDAAAEVAGAITPVPGGVGPMTIACLLANTLRAAAMRAGLPPPKF